MVYADVWAVGVYEYEVQVTMMPRLFLKLYLHMGDISKGDASVGKRGHDVCVLSLWS